MEKVIVFYILHWCELSVKKESDIEKKRKDGEGRVCLCKKL